MTDKEKDLAIYQAMCEVATNYFNRVVRECETFREFMAKKSIISLKELNKCSEWIIATRTVDADEKVVEVDTFRCSYVEDDFGMLLVFKSIAKVKQEFYFAYEEQIDNEFVGSVDITFDNPAGAKSLEAHASKDELRPIMNYVMVEVNAKTCDINIVASDCHSLGVISTNPARVHESTDADKLFHALFTKEDWKSICDYAKKSKASVKFDVYRRKECEWQDTMVAVIGDKSIRSKCEECYYPNWRNVIGSQDGMLNFNIHPDDVEAARKWISKAITNAYGGVYLSFYKGSDLLYFDIYNDEGRTSTRTFRLTQTSGHTIGKMYNVDFLRKTKFTGFYINKSEDGAGFIKDQNTDIMLVMPMISNNGYVFDVENREVIAESAMEVELVA